MYNNPSIRPLWKDIWDQKEDSLRIRFGRQVESLSPKTRDLPPLSVGDTCRVQNQTGHHPTKWDRTGVVVKVNNNNQYLIKMHGSGRVSLRNRKLLRRIQSYVPNRRIVHTVFVPTSMSGSETPPVSDQETACDKVRTLETTDEVTEAAPASQLPPTQVSLDTPEDPHTVLLPPPTETVSDVDDAVVSKSNSDTQPITATSNSRATPSSLACRLQNALKSKSLPARSLC